MALDMAKYQRLFLEESTEHLAEMSRALLELEKDTASVESIDVIFRMSHSIKSMAASLGHDSVTELAHRLEDRMQETRNRGEISGPYELSLLFRGLEGLEALVAAVRDSGEAPGPPAELMAELSQTGAEADPEPSDSGGPTTALLRPNEQIQPESIQAADKAPKKKHLI